MASTPVIYDDLPLLIDDGSGGLIPALAEDPCDCCGEGGVTHDCDITDAGIEGSIVGSDDCDVIYRFAVDDWPAALANEVERKIWWGTPNYANTNTLLGAACGEGMCLAVPPSPGFWATSGGSGVQDAWDVIDHGTDWEWIDIQVPPFCSPTSVGFFLQIKTTVGNESTYHYYYGQGCFYQTCDPLLVKVAHYLGEGADPEDEPCACYPGANEFDTFAYSLPDTVEADVTYRSTHSGCQTSYSGIYILNRAGGDQDPCEQRYVYNDSEPNCVPGTIINFYATLCGEGYKVRWDATVSYAPDDDDDCPSIINLSGISKGATFKTGCTGTDNGSQPEPVMYGMPTFFCQGGYISEVTFSW